MACLVHSAAANMGAALWLAGLLEIVGPTTCPSAADVSAAWRRLGGPVADAPRRVVLSDAAEGVSITLLDEAGRTLAEQTIPATGRCRALASTAAVIVGAWLAHLRLASPATDAPAPPVPPAPTPLPAIDAPPAAPATSPRPPVVAAPTVPAARVSVVRAAASPPRVRWALSAGAVAALTGTAAAAGGELALSLAPARGGFSGRLSLLGVGPRQQPLGSGAASFTRVALALGPAYRWWRGRWGLEAHAAALTALLVVHGVGFDVNRQALDFDVGLGGGARVLLRLGPVVSHLGVAVAGWLRTQTVRVDDLSTELPRYDVLFVAGLGFGSFR